MLRRSALSSVACLKDLLWNDFFQKPIISSPSQAEEHCEYFDKLISEQFDTYTNTTQPIQIVKVGKRFRVKAIVVVAKEALRKNLENAGIVRKLGL